MKQELQKRQNELHARIDELFKRINRDIDLINLDYAIEQLNSLDCELANITSCYHKN